MAWWSDGHGEVCHLSLCRFGLAVLAFDAHQHLVAVPVQGHQHPGDQAGSACTSGSLARAR